MKKFQILALSAVLCVIPFSLHAQGRTPTSAVVSTTGTEALGDRTVTFIFSSDFVGTVLGVAYNGATDASITFPPLGPGETYGAIAYTRSAGSIRIVRVK